MYDFFIIHLSIVYIHHNHSMQSDRHQLLPWRSVRGGCPAWFAGLSFWDTTQVSSTRPGHNNDLNFFFFGALWFNFDRFKKFQTNCTETVPNGMDLTVKLTSAARLLCFDSSGSSSDPSAAKPPWFFSAKSLVKKREKHWSKLGKTDKSLGQKHHWFFCLHWLLVVFAWHRTTNSIGATLKCLNQWAVKKSIH